MERKSHLFRGEPLTSFEKSLYSEGFRAGALSAADPG